MASAVIEEDILRRLVVFMLDRSEAQLRGRQRQNPMIEALTHSKKRASALRTHLVKLPAILHIRWRIELVMVICRLLSVSIACSGQLAIIDVALKKAHSPGRQTCRSILVLMSRQKCRSDVFGSRTRAFASGLPDAGSFSEAGRGVRDSPLRSIVGVVSCSRWLSRVSRL